MAMQGTDLRGVKARQQQTWAAGDFARLGNRMVIMGELLSETAELRGGQRVLDVATGSGNTALSAARRFCDVTGVDYVPALIEQAKARAAAERLEVVFEVGDAEQLPYPDASFDAVLSTIGVMFAPDQQQAAVELVRVCRPGGTIGLANWTPQGFVADMFGTIGRHVPPPDVPSPLLWGTEERLRELFGRQIDSLDVTERRFVFRARSVTHWIEHYRSYFGPLNQAFAALDVGGQENLTADLTAFLRRHNVSGEDNLVLPADYLEVIAVTAARS